MPHHMSGAALIDDLDLHYIAERQAAHSYSNENSALKAGESYDVKNLKSAFPA